MDFQKRNFDEEGMNLIISLATSPPTFTIKSVTPRIVRLKMSQSLPFGQIKVIYREKN